LIRISLTWVIDVVQAVDALQNIQAGKPYSESWGYIYFAHSNLDALLSQSLYSNSIVSSRSSAEKLRSKLAESLARQRGDVVNDAEVWLIEHLRRDFKTILNAELATLPTFFVSSKPPYSTEALLSGGEAMMPLELQAKVPEAVFDVKEAARCMAFELGTAGAFHLFRALEAVVRRYYSEVAKGQAEPKQRNLGVYIRALTPYANRKVISVLTQLKDLYRNPIAHPEAAITLEESITIAGLVRSAIAAMLNELPTVPQTTTLPSVQKLAEMNLGPP